MILSIDEREDSLFARCRERMAAADPPIGALVSLKKRVLLLGDASIAGIGADAESTDICIFERKSLADLAASIKDGRYAEQSHRLTHASNLHTHNIVYVIEGQLSTAKGPARARAVSAIVSLALFKGFSVTRTTSVDETAELLISAAVKIAKNLAKHEHLRFGAAPATEGGMASTDGGMAAEVVPSYATVANRVKKENLTPENFCEIVLVQIPGVSASIAALVVARTPTLTGLAEQLRANDAFLDDIRVPTQGSGGTKSRRIGTNVVAAIKKFVLAL
jgi:ERCC4-type nuclease